MSDRHENRPISPYMLGPYYRFQVTSLLSITNRLTGVVLTVVSAPLAIAWLVALALGPQPFEALRACLGGWLGQAALLLSLFSLVYHLLGGIRHLVWDTGHGFEMSQVRLSGWVTVIASALLTALTWWAVA